MTNNNIAKRKKIFMWIICISFFVFLHIFMNVKIQDDNTFKSTLSEMGLIKYLVNTYYTWSSQVIINAADVFFMAQPIWVWQIADILVILLLFYELQKVCYHRFQNPSSYFLLGLLGSFQLSHMSNAGWIATTINYLWALGIGLPSLTALIGLAKGRRYKWYQYVFFILSFSFGCSSKLMAAIIVTVFVVIMIYFEKEKIEYPKWYIRGGIIVSLIILGVHITCPGERMRLMSEIKKFMPEYVHLSVFDKLKLNYIAMFEHFISKPNAIFFLFCLLLMLGVFLKCNLYGKRIIASIPIGIDMVGTVYFFVLQHIGIKKDGYEEPVLFCKTLGQNIEQIGMILAFTILIVAICASLYWIVEDKLLYGEMVLIIALGFATRMVLSFSPTMFASSTRIYIFLYAALIIVTAMLAELLKDKFSKVIWAGLYIICMVGALINVITLWHLSQALAGMK